MVKHNQTSCRQKPQRHQMHEIISHDFFFPHFEVEKTTNPKREKVHLWY